MPPRSGRTADGPDCRRRCRGTAWQGLDIEELNLRARLPPGRGLTSISGRRARAEDPGRAGTPLLGTTFQAPGPSRHAIRSRSELAGRRLLGLLQTAGHGKLRDAAGYLFRTTRRRRARQVVVATREARHRVPPPNSWHLMTRDAPCWIGARDTTAAPGHGARDEKAGPAPVPAPGHGRQQSELDGARRSGGFYGD